MRSKAFLCVMLYQQGPVLPLSISPFLVSSPSVVICWSLPSATPFLVIIRRFLPLLCIGKTSKTAAVYTTPQHVIDRYSLALSLRSVNEHLVEFAEKRDDIRRPNDSTSPRFILLLPADFSSIISIICTLYVELL